jgi:hypothetical protein
MNLRQTAVLVASMAGVAREVGEALARFERKRRSLPSRSATALLLVGVGAAVGAIAASPELRRKLRDAFLRTSKHATSAGGQVEPQQTTQPSTAADGVVA